MSTMDDITKLTDDEVMKLMDTELECIIKLRVFQNALAWLVQQPVVPVPTEDEPVAMCTTTGQYNGVPLNILMIANVGAIVAYKNNVHTCPMSSIGTQRGRAQCALLSLLTADMADENTRVLSDVPKE